MAGFTKREDTPLQTERKVQKALKTLGMDPRIVWPVDAIRTQYGSLVKATHPDSGERRADLPSRYDGVTLEEFRRAKDYLVKQLENEHDA